MSRRASTSKTRRSPSTTARPEPSSSSRAAALLGIGERTDTGELHFVALPRIRTHRNRDRNGKYRWYNDYQLPDRYGNQTITVRLHGNDQDAARKLNRTENLRPIPPGDPDFERLFPRRNDAESINRHLDDTMWLGRAHSIGHTRQLLNLLGFALTINSLALSSPSATQNRATRRVDAATSASFGTERAPTTPTPLSQSAETPRGPKDPAQPRSPYPGQSGDEVFDHQSRRPRPRSSGDRASVS